jgi:hypothetical protein
MHLHTRPHVHSVVGSSQVYSGWTNGVSTWATRLIICQRVSYGHMATVSIRLVAVAVCRPSP